MAWRTARGLTHADVARLIGHGVTRQNIQYLEANPDAVPRYVRRLAHVIGLTADDLLDDRVTLSVSAMVTADDSASPLARDSERPYKARSSSEEFQEVPVLIDPPTQGAEAALEEVPPCYVPALGPCGPNGYALRQRGDSMLNPAGFPTFPDGCLLFVNPDIEPTPSRYVIAKVHGGGWTCRRLIAEAGETYLRPLNPTYPLAKLDERFTICGVVVGAGFDAL